MSSPETLCVELRSLEIASDGEAFVLGFVAPNEDVHRMELPRWTLHQLMRMLPRLDAALLQARNEPCTDLIAHPVLGWTVEPAGTNGAVVLSVRDARQIESAYLFEVDDALTLHSALGDALADAGQHAMSKNWQPASIVAAA